MIVFFCQKCSSPSESVSLFDKNSSKEFRWVAFEGFSCSPENQIPGKNPGTFCKSNKDVKDYLYIHTPVLFDSKLLNSDYRTVIQSCAKDLSQSFVSHQLSIDLYCFMERFSGCDLYDRMKFYEMLREHVKETGVQNCCPVDKNTGKCTEIVNYEQCLCTVYLKIEGGYDKFADTYYRYAGGRSGSKNQWLSIEYRSWICIWNCTALSKWRRKWFRADTERILPGANLSKIILTSFNNLLILILLKRIWPCWVIRIKNIRNEINIKNVAYQ